MDEGMPKKNRRKEKPYTGLGVAPTMKVELVQHAKEIEDYLREHILPVKFSQFLESAADNTGEWEDKDEYQLIKALSKHGPLHWLRSPTTYLALVQVMRERANGKPPTKK